MSKCIGDIINVGVNDFEIDLFESQYVVPNGISYNSYLVCDDKITIFDTVDSRFCKEWLGNIEKTLDGKQPDYLIVQHMEPDHSGSIFEFVKTYPNATIVTNAKALSMINQFFDIEIELNTHIVKDGDMLCTGKHEFSFVFAPMIHWPEVMVTYDSFSKVLFSADAFGTFGVYKHDEAVDVKEWAEEASRYYIGIVGKYGVQVQNLLKKASNLDIETICSLHGPVLKENIADFVRLYDIWSSYRVEKEGIVIVYASAHGHTKEAALYLENILKTEGYKDVVVYDLSRCDMFKAIADAFRYSKLVTASITYNGTIFPVMETFLRGLSDRKFGNKFVGMVENGSWAPNATRIMSSMIDSCKGVVFAENNVTIKSSMDNASREAISKLADELLVFKADI